MSSALPDVTSSVLQFQGNKKEREMQERIHDENVERQERHRKEIFSREDTAVQRRAADLKKAGLSKTLAAGSPAQVVSQTAPQRGTPSGQNPLTALGGVMERIGQKNIVMSLLKSKADIARTKAEKKLVDLKSDLQEWDNQQWKKLQLPSNTRLDRYGQLYTVAKQNQKEIKDKILNVKPTKYELKEMKKDYLWRKESKWYPKSLLKFHPYHKYSKGEK